MPTPCVIAITLVTAGAALGGCTICVVLMLKSMSEPTPIPTRWLHLAEVMTDNSLLFCLVREGDDKQIYGAWSSTSADQ